MKKNYDRPKYTFFAASALTFASSMLFASPSYGITVCSVPSVADFVTPIGAGSYQYSYGVSISNSGGCLTSGDRFAVPYFTDAGITNINSPTGWTYTIDNVDTFGLGFGAETLRWAAGGGFSIPVGGNLSGFGYTASYGAVKGPFSVSDGRRTVFGDPAIPGSPNALAAGLKQETTAVPEPSGGAFLSSLLVAGVIVRFRRNRPQSNQEF
jgi:hypothetical protein